MSATVTDLFAGAGGSSTGAEQAGAEVLIAANHWRLAVDTHQANHPDTAHDCADISQVDPRRYPHTDILWASPSCTHHSRAQGKARLRSVDEDLFRDSPQTWQEAVDAEPDRSRATMFDVVRFAEAHHYEGIIVENVPEIREWNLFPYWLAAMTSGLGYNYRPNILNSALACGSGPAVPQSRERFYGVFWLGSHAPAIPTQRGPMPSAETILDADPGPLVTSRARLLAASTMGRIGATVERYPDAERMIVSYYGSSKCGRPVSEPVPTLTTHDRHAVITRTPQGLCYRMLNIREQARTMGFPDSYIWHGTGRDITKQIGNAVTVNAARDVVSSLIRAIGEVAA